MKIQYGECHCGCGQKTNIRKVTNRNRGHIKGEPYLYTAGHQNRKLTPKYKVDENGCWIWQRAINSTGYGNYWVNGKCKPAHRVFYESYKGKIPDGLHIDHLCRVPACVNPEHLEAVTNAENVRRGNTPKINMEIANEIRILYATGKYTHETLGKMYGLYDNSIWKITNMKVWNQ